MKNTAKKLLGATVVASILAAAAAPAMAQPGGEGKGPRGGQFAPMMFSDLDTNGDGVLTQEELDARKADRFAETDTNGDGKLSADEMFAYQEKQAVERKQQRMARMIERLDTDKDGFLSAEELEARGGDKERPSLFERADADNNGEITEKEFKSAMAKMKRFGKQGGHGKEFDRQ